MPKLIINLPDTVAELEVPMLGIFAGNGEYDITEEQMTAFKQAGYHVPADGIIRIPVPSPIPVKQLDDKLKSELQALAKERGVEGYSTMTKEQLQDALAEGGGE